MRSHFYCSVPDVALAIIIAPQLSAMDKYVIRTPRFSNDSETTSNLSLKHFKQKTLHSLRGVVVVEVIEHLKSILELPSQSKEVMLKSLLELEKKIPPRNVLLATKIGRTVNKLRKFPDEEVASQARRVYIKWRTFFQKHQELPQIEVKFDKKAESLRQKGKTLLSQALGLENDHELVVAVEMSVFRHHKRLTSPAYCKSIRSLVLKLKNKEELRMSVVNGELPVEDLVKSYKNS